MPLISRSVPVAIRLAVALAPILACAAVNGEGTLGEGRLRVIGASFDVEPVSQTVPVGVPALLRTTLSSDPSGYARAGLRVFAELSGPGLAAPVTLTADPGSDLRLPPLSLKGVYRLEGIRLANGAGTSVPALHPVATVTVTDVLVSSITSRVLTPEELADRGIVLDDRNLRAFSFALGLAIQGRTIEIGLPPLVWNGTEYVPVGPPRVDVEGPPQERFPLPSVIAVPLREDLGAPPPFERDEFLEDDVAPTPVFGLLVFPGTVRFLNQFFSVLLVVRNGSSDAPGLVLKDVSTTVQLPAAALRLAGSTPSAAVGEPVPVRHPGADGVLGTPDDLVVLAAGQAGSAEMVAEGLRVGTHEVVCWIEATLEGLAGQPPRRLSGRARGSVVVRDPAFALTFQHPEVVRKDEEYDVGVTVSNTSTVRANRVSLAIDAGSLSGAVVVGVGPGADPVAELGDILPGEAADARFRLRATRTGRVVASSFTSDGSVTGVLRLRTGVTNDGTPLSPDTLVFPGFLAELPERFADAAKGLVGLAQGLATADPTVAGSLDAPGFSDGAVRARAAELVQAARRIRTGQTRSSAMAEVLLQWLGSRDEVPAFDLLRRVHRRGRELEAAAAAILGDALKSAGREHFDELLVDAAAANVSGGEPASAVAGPVLAILDAEDSERPAARLRLRDPRTGTEASGAADEARPTRDLPYAALLSFSAPGATEAGLVGRLAAHGLDVLVEGRRTGSATLDLVYPDGRGGFSRARFASIPVREGSVASVRVVKGAARLELESSVDTRRSANAAAAPPSPFAAVAAVQDVDANPLGRVVTVLFNRAVDEGSAGDPGRWRLPTVSRGGDGTERALTAVAVSADGRLVSLASGVTVSPVRPGTARGDRIPAERGETWSGELSIVPRLLVDGGEVEGRVLGPDGAPLAHAEVRLSEHATDDLTGRSFETTTARTRTDARGAFAFDFVRKQDGRPFRLDALDPATGSAGWAAGSIRRNGDVVHVDVALLGRGTVRGRVVDVSGVRVSGAIVRISASVEVFRRSLFSAPDGSFVFSSVPVGTLQLQAEEPRSRATSWATARVEAAGGSSDVTLVLSSRPRARLSGRVVVGAGRGLAGAWVAGYGEADEYFGARQVPEDGSFLFESCPAGSVRLEVFDGRSREPALVQPLSLLPDGNHDVTLVVGEEVPRFGSVTGTIRRVVAGVATAVAGAPVWVTKGGLRTTSGADGTYRIDDVPTGSTSLGALLPASGRSATVPVTVLEGAVATADLLFPDASLGSVRGTVVDQTGAPRADALVEIWETGPPLRLVAGARSGADGTFLLPSVPPGSWRIQATSVETRGGTTLRNAGAATATLPGPGAAATVTVPLRGFVEVTGRVVARVRAANGEVVDSPVYCQVEIAAGRFAGATAGESVSADDPEAGRLFVDGPAPAGTVRTDPANGSFRFRFVHGGSIRVVARNPFYGDRAHDLGFVAGDAVRGPIELAFDGNLGVVDGFLRAPDGAPVAGAPVTLQPLGTPFADRLEATTGSDGSFLFPLVPFGESSRVTFSGPLAEKARSAEARVRVTAASPRSRVVLDVVPVGDFTVHVVEAGAGAGRPIAGAEVRVEETESPRRVFTGVTGVDGTARFADVSAVPLAVAARKDLVAGRGAALGEGEGFRVDATVALDVPAEVAGTVRRPSDGASVAGVNVLLDAGPWRPAVGAATTGADGRYRIEGIPGGDGTVYRVRVEDPRNLRRGASAAFQLRPGDAKDVDVALRSLGSVTGVVRTFEGGRPVGRAEVDVASVDEEERAGETLRVSTGEDGRYRADGIAEGRVLVRARAAESGLSASGTGSLAGEDGTLELDLTLNATGRVRGRCLGPDGAPLGGSGPPSEVRLEAGARHDVRLSNEYDFADVDATAPFVLKAVERVEPFRAGILRGRAVAGQVVAANLRLSPFGTLRVRIVKPDPDHHGLFLPAPGVVVLSCGEPYEFRFPCGSPVRSDSEGVVTIPRVGVGSGGRLVASEEATGAAGAAAVEPLAFDGETRDATVVVEARGVARGRLLLGAGAAPAAAAVVRVQLPDVRGGWLTLASTVSAPDGRFELRDVPLATVVLRAETTSGPLARAEVTASLSAASPVHDAGDVVMDDTRPRVVSISPLDGARDVTLLPVVEALFSEPLGATSYGRSPGAFVELSGPHGNVRADVSLEAGGMLLRLRVPPDQPLSGATPYRIRVLGTLPDRAGMTLGGDVVAAFTTADLTAPTVATSAPLPGEIQVGVDVNPVVVFTKAIDAATVASGARLERLDAPRGLVTCAPVLRSDGRTVALNPGRPLEAEAEYVLVVDGIADVAGNRLPHPARIPFLTRDDRAPIVLLDAPSVTSPLEGSLQSYTMRFSDDDVGSARLEVAVPTGTSNCGDARPESGATSVSFSCLLPRIAAAGGTSVVLRARAVDRSGNASLPASATVTLAPDAPPVVEVRSPVAGARVLSGTTLEVSGTVAEDNGAVTVSARFGNASRGVAGPGSFSLALPVPVVAAPSTLVLEVRATDQAGNVSRPALVPIGVDPDLTPPAVSIASPDAGVVVLGGRTIRFVASATDDAGVVALRWRAGGGSWVQAAGNVLSVSVTTTVVPTETPFAIEAEARDAGGNVSTAARTVRLVPNLPPGVTVTAPGPAFRVTAGSAFAVEGGATDDGGIPIVTAGYGGDSRTSTGNRFAFSFVAPAVSVPTETAVRLVATDPEGNRSAEVTVPVTVVPDVGGTPTIALLPDGLELLLGTDDASVVLRYADNVGLDAASAEVTGGLSSGGRVPFAFSGTTVERTVAVVPGTAPFGTPARVVAGLRNVSARSVALDVSLPVAFHRLDGPLANGPAVEGSALSGAFRVTPEGRRRAAALRLEIGTRSPTGFSVLACARKAAPLAEVETLAVVVPAGRTDLVLRSVLQEADGSEAPATDVDGRSPFERPLPTVPDTLAPTVSISTPVAGAEIASGALVAVEAVAVDDVGLRSLEVTFAGSTKTCSKSPCRVSFFAPRVTATTSHAVTATARDRSGLGASASLPLTVTPPSGPTARNEAVGGDDLSPRVAFVTPVLGSAYVAPGSTYVPWVDASGADGIDTIELFLGDRPGEPCLVLRMPEDGWPPRKGCAIPEAPEGTEWSLVARARDRSGRTAEALATLVVREGLRVRGPGLFAARGSELADSRVYVEGDVEVDGELHVGALHLRAGATLRPAPGGSSPDAVRIRVRDELVLDAGSRIDVSATGAQPASELAPSSGPDREGDGAPHGGAAGCGTFLREPYDSASAPSLPGARGGTAGTFGGGLVALSAERIALAGVVAADGEEGNADRPAWRGLGSGGSIVLSAREAVIAPARGVDRRWGFLSARAGGHASAEASPAPAALAAGGRVAVEAARVTVPFVDVSGSWDEAEPTCGGRGTVWLRDALRPDGIFLGPSTGSGEASPGPGAAR